jgi:hypothetical protein
MRRINTSTKATDLHGPGKHGFKAGNNLTGELPTQLSPTYCDDVQEEICNAIEGAGITLGADQSQLLAAIIALADQRAALRASFTGEVSHAFSSTAPAGWVRRHGGTIGNAASNATERAHADTFDLFAKIWAETANVDDFVIKDSAGSPTTRGVSAAADFAANKQMPLPDDRGRFDRGLNTSGSGLDAGRTLASTQVDDFKSHTHDFTDTAPGQHGGGGAFNVDAMVDAERPTGATGGSETRPVNRAYLAIIKL